MTVSLVFVATALQFGTIGLSGRQDPLEQRFEVASVRVNTTGASASSFRIRGGEVVATNYPLELMMWRAYEVAAQFGKYKFRDGPAAVLSARFDIWAKAPPGVSDVRVPQMLRNLLEERFGLTLHTELRQVPAYALEAVREGRFGSELRRSELDCDRILADLRAKGILPNDTNAPRDANNRPACWSRVEDEPMPQGAWRVRGAGSIARLVLDLQAFVDRPIVDATALSGSFEWRLFFNPLTERQSSDFPAVYTALQEQLGLRLRPTTQLLEVFVIDSLSMPTPN